MKKTIAIHLIALLSLLLWGVGGLQAQEMERRNFTVVVKDANSGAISHSQVNYVTFQGKYGEATQARERLMRAYGSDPMFDLATAISGMKKDLNRSRSNGTFTTGTLIEGSGVLVIASGGEIMEAVKIESGKLDYTVTLVTKTTLKEVNVQGKNRVPDVVVKPVPGMDTGSDVSFNINFQLRAGMVNDDCRIIVQPAAMDCLTEDTVAYLQPATFEGAKYHALQDRRKGFDFYRNDSLARGYDSTVIIKEDYPVVVNYNVSYHKANKDRTYKGVYRYVVEDYHHLLYDNGWDGTGSCLAFKPFKFLDFSDGGAEMELTQEFMTPPEDNIRKVNTTLNLTFEQGKGNVLTADSTNELNMKKLVKELQSAGGTVFKFTIQGCSSPEGGFDKNKNLAIERANYAKNLVRPYLRGVTINTEEPVVYTWKDVLEEVKKRGNQDVADQVANVIANTEEKYVYGTLKGLPFFDSDIVPALSSLRAMKCTYLVELKHIMNEDEVAEFYYSNKESLKSGRSGLLSDGDYYNLFRAVTDSAELDTITELAYKHVVSQPAYENLPLAPYVANRMALLNIRRGMPDANVLRPFIDFTKKINGWHIVDMDTKYKVNRPEQLINQAITYFQDGKIDTASYILVDCGSGDGFVPKSERTKKMRMYITFSRNYIAMLNGGLDASKVAATKEAADYVFSTGKENKAILFTELHANLDKTREDCEALIDQLDDSNPKKWYLKGIIWSDEAGKEPALDGDVSEPADDDPFADDDEKKDNDKIPHYLAYFQHCFDLEPKYKRFYFNEGNVSDKLRKAHPYRKKEIPAYRELFKRIIEQRDSNAAVETTAPEAPAAGEDNAAPATGEENTENTDQQ